MHFKAIIIIVFLISSIETLACGKTINSHGNDYIDYMSKGTPYVKSTDLNDFSGTYPDSVAKDKLIKILAESKRSDFFITHIQYFQKKRKLIIKGYETKTSCAGVSAYMRVLDKSNYFLSINLDSLLPVKVGQEETLSFVISLYLKEDA